MSPDRCLGRIWQLCARIWRQKTLWTVMVIVMLVCGKLMTMTQIRTHRPEWLTTETCSPRTNVAFLKTHKCASSSIQNILIRYGNKHNLHFALPDRGNYFGGTLSFRAEMVSASPLNKFTPNIFAIHTKWNHSEIKKVMPEDTAFLTIIREPVDVFHSYFIFGEVLKKTNLTLDQFVRKVPVDAKRIHGYLGYNQMTWDFGMPMKDMNNLTAVQELVRKADEEFGLVLLAERMEESLVLLAHYLCWDLSDVLVLRLNSLNDKYKTPLPDETREILQKKLSPDYVIYNHFHAKFEELVNNFGRRKMANQVERLIEQMELLLSICDFTKKESTLLRGREKPWSTKVDGFVTTGGDGCKFYSMAEAHLIEYVRQKQRKEVFAEFGLPLGPPLNAIPLQPAAANNAMINKLRRNRIQKGGAEDEHKTTARSHDKKEKGTNGTTVQ